MKTDLNKLQADINAGIETLVAVDAELGKAERKNQDEAAEVLRQQQLVGHAISGLRGVAASLQGLSNPRPSEPSAVNPSNP